MGRRDVVITLRFYFLVLSIYPRFQSIFEHIS